MHKLTSCCLLTFFIAVFSGVSSAQTVSAGQAASCRAYARNTLAEQVRADYVGRLTKGASTRVPKLVFEKFDYQDLPTTSAWLISFAADDGQSVRHMFAIVPCAGTPIEYSVDDAPIK